MVWGYRHHLPDSGYSDSVPLARGLSDDNQLPRRAIEMYDDATGLVLVEDTDQQVTDFDHLDIGDLVFFDGSTDDGDAIDHVGGMSWDLTRWVTGALSPAARRTTAPPSPTAAELLY